MLILLFYTSTYYVQDILTSRTVFNNQEREKGLLFSPIKDFGPFCLPVLEFCNLRGNVSIVLALLGSKSYGILECGKRPRRKFLLY
jgi:hypothetical protein